MSGALWLMAAYVNYQSYEDTPAKPEGSLQRESEEMGESCT
jgi:hypothetical protein